MQLLTKIRNQTIQMLKKACKEIGMNLRAGCLVIVASTMGLGITESLIKETLENASGLKEERTLALLTTPQMSLLRPILEDLANLSRVVGGINKRSIQIARLILKTIIKGEIVEMENIRQLKLSNFSNMHIKM